MPPESAAELMPAPGGVLERLARRAHRHPTATSAVVYALLTGAFMWPVLLRGASFTTMGAVGNESPPWGSAPLSGNVPQIDQAVLSAPWQAELTRAVGRLTLPFWSEQFGGFPLFSNAASGQLYPPRLLIAALGLSPLRAHDTFVALHLIGAGLAAYLLLRELGIGVDASRFGGAVWMLCGFNTAWLHFEVLSPQMVMLPLCMLMTRRAVRRCTPPSVAAAAVVLAITLMAGQIPFAVLSFMVALLDGFGVAAIVRRSWRAVVHLAAAGVAAAGLAAVVLLPTARTLAAGSRTAVEFDDLGKTWAPTGEPLLLDPAALVHAAIPDANGLSIASLNGSQVFVGSLVVLLALAGACTRRSGRITGLAMSVGMAVLTVGGPLTWVAFHVNPLFHYFRPYGRALGVFSLGVVVLAALGMDALLTSLRADRSSPDEQGVRAQRPAWSVYAVVFAVTVVQLLVHGHDVSRGTFVDASPAPMGATPLVDAIAELQRREPWPARVQPLRSGASLAPFLGDTSALFDLRTTAGYDSSVPSRTLAVARYLEGASAEEAVTPLPDPYVTSFAAGTPRLELAARLGVAAFVVAAGGWQASAPPVQAVYTGPDGELYLSREPIAVPRVVFETVEAANEQVAFSAFFEPDFDWQNQAVVEREQLARSSIADEMVAGSGAAAGDPTATAQVVGSGINSLRLEVTSSEPGLLVIPRNWDAGWHAEVDNASAPVLRVNYNQQAVPVRAGRTIVELRYRPDGSVPGLGIAAVTAALLGAAIAVHLVRRPVRRSPT